jgi:hypothetical protein
MLGFVLALLFVLTTYRTRAERQKDLHFDIGLQAGKACVLYECKCPIGEGGMFMAIGSMLYKAISLGAFVQTVM